MLGMVDEIEVESDIEFNRLLGVISQRLVRKLCPQCKPVTHLDIEQINGFDISPDDDIYQANGCPECLQTGFRGPTGIYEVAGWRNSVFCYAAADKFAGFDP